MSGDSSLKRAVTERILNEILADDGTGEWKVLILDDFTTRVLSSAVKMGDILDRNVSIVEDLYKDRQPFPGLSAVYFVQPTQRNVERILEDFSGPKGLYQAVHIFFSSQVRPKLVDRIKESPGCLLRCIKGLKEGNLEIITIDSRTVVTEHQDCLSRLMGPGADHRTRASDISSVVARLATLFGTLKDFPVIRYAAPPRPPAPSTSGATAPPPPEAPLKGADGRSTLTRRVGVALLERLVGMQKSGVLPSRETCDLIILDRSYDPLAPFIHEWTYESMVHDLLADKLEGNIYKYSTDAKETKESFLDERDPQWLELRHMFIAEVYAAIATRFKEFQSKNKAAKAAGTKGSTGEMGLGSMRALIAALPQYHDILSRMSLHIQVSSELKGVTNDRLLTEVGEIEQDLIFGEKTSKDLVTFLTDHHDKLNPEDTLRLLMCYLITHPERLDQAKRDQWVKLGGLTQRDMEAIRNLAYLGVQIMKPASAEKAEGGGFFGSKKDKKDKEKSALRKPREEEEGYALFRFEPLLRGILSDLHANKLPLAEFPYIRPPAAGGGGPATEDVSTAQATSARSGKSSLNWAKRGQGEGGGGGGGPGVGGGGGPGGGGAGGGRRLIVFMVGGALHSEMRLVHQLSLHLGRDILLASSSIETPKSIIDQLRVLGIPDPQDD